MFFRLCQQVTVKQYKLETILCDSSGESHNVVECLIEEEVDYRFTINVNCSCRDQIKIFLFSVLEVKQMCLQHFP